MGNRYDFNGLRLGVPDGMISRWRKVAGLLAGPGGWLRRESAKLVPVRPDERFDRFVTQQVEAYVERGELPAENVAAGILQLAGDVMAGREPTLRAVDYIAIQNHLRQARS
jgi:hypothetical protein